MKNNIIIKKINIVLSVLFLYSCIDQMQDAGDAKKVTPVRGTVTIQVNTGFVTKAGDPGIFYHEIDGFLFLSTQAS